MDDATLGFIGLGVMGAPMCRNLASKSHRTVVAFDLRQPAPGNAVAAGSVEEVVERADVVFLSLPGEAEVREVAMAIPAGTAVVDCSTAPVSLARELAGRFEHFADAPVARTRQAAIDGTLSAMVGAPPEFFRRIEPLLRCMATDVTHCGPPGAGQAVKLLNNMVLSVTVLALAEALAVAKASGAVDPQVLFEALAKGSADSFALRSHGMKALLPEEHPARAFSTSYMLKDLGYALELASSARLELQAAGTARRMLERTVALGFGDAYHTAVLEAVKKHLSDR
ncbi:MAG TPA: NAD(P)-dependent oxidoreductase [Burkholderiales bacterium]|jgi:3-hydroxyisobutyrate dehydrogenase-like beta-hydroxyacid dehydrogenase